MARLESSWDLAHQSGEPHTLIRVRNLQTVLPVGSDAWGRPNLPQPVLISASISLSQPFISASETDSVTNSTVHYGILSKAILKACAEFKGLPAGSAGKEVNDAPSMSLRALVQYLHFYLTGQDAVMAGTADPAGGWREVDGELEHVLKGQGMRMLELKVMLPKGSLLGSGVSLKASFAYDGTSKGPSAYSMVLTLHELRIPTLIGVNPNERLAKQLVVANMEMEKWNMAEDAYCQLEEIVVKTIEESSFETLEALSSHLSGNIIKYFLIPQFPAESKAGCLAGKGEFNHQRIRISLEKPTAVMFADAPVIEVLIDSDPSKSQVVREIWESAVGQKQPPFPLTGSLSDWENGHENRKS